MDYTKLNEEQLDLLLAKVSREARSNYKLKKDLETEKIRRALSEWPTEISTAKLRTRRSPRWANTKTDNQNKGMG